MSPLATVAAAILALAASAHAASVAAAAPEDLRFDADDGNPSDAVDHGRELIVKGWRRKAQAHVPDLDRPAVVLGRDAGAVRRQPDLGERRAHRLALLQGAVLGGVQLSARRQRSGLPQGVPDRKQEYLIGVHRWDNGVSGQEHKCSETRNVDRIVMHPYYDSSTDENDVALIFLRDPAPCIADESGETEFVQLDDGTAGGKWEDRYATVTGWGARQPARATSRTSCTKRRCSCARANTAARRSIATSASPTRSTRAARRSARTRRAATTRATATRAGLSSRSLPATRRSDWDCVVGIQLRHALPVGLHPRLVLQVVDRGDGERPTRPRRRRRRRRRSRRSSSRRPACSSSPAARRSHRWHRSACAPTLPTRRRRPPTAPAARSSRSPTQCCEREAPHTCRRRPATASSDAECFGGVPGDPA